MRKIILLLLAFLLIVGALGVYGIYYIRPDPTLNLDYRPVSLKDKALDMVKRMSTELVLTEEDVSNLLKQALSENPPQIPDVEVLGAQFALTDRQLTADLRLLWKKRIAAGMQVTYTLAWSDPNLTARVESVRLQSFNLPKDMVEDVAIPIGQQLPSLVRIKDMEFGGQAIRIRLQPPSLKELAEWLPDWQLLQARTPEPASARRGALPEPNHLRYTES